jgi:hypothetical protein
MNLDTLAKALSWFHKAVPEPTSQNLHTQLGCHFEEVNEMVMAITTKDFATQIHLDCAKSALHSLSEHLKTHDGVVEILPKDREEYLDALCDQIVTATGCAHMSDLDILGGMFEVNGSNFSKFDDAGEPIFDGNRKVRKGANYRKADLSAYV